MKAVLQAPKERRYSEARASRSLRSKAANVPASPGAHPHSAQLSSWSDFKRALKMDA
ncbi:MAG: hypothetical protein AB7E49_06530 [Campylobacterales bacterium]